MLMMMMMMMMVMIVMIINEKYEVIGKCQDQS